uniref:hypothetical protein n=1 Tax=Enterococcus rotai TaxID=118060 RepID=UPI0035C77584
HKLEHELEAGPEYVFSDIVFKPACDDPVALASRAEGKAERKAEADRIAAENAEPVEPPKEETKNEKDAWTLKFKDPFEG